MNDQLLHQAIQTIQSGDRKTGGRLLYQLVQRDPHNEIAWLWLATCIDTDKGKRHCLQRALESNPQNHQTREALNRLSEVAPPPLETLAPRRVVPKPSEFYSQARSESNTVNSIIIVLLVVLGLYWIGIAALQIFVGLNDPASEEFICMGGWNLIASLINLALIEQVMKHQKRAVQNLTGLAILGSFFGLLQLLAGAWLQIITLPLYILLGVLAQVNKAQFTELTPKELRRLEKKRRTTKG